MWKEYNPNPVGRRVIDCAVRAVSKALNMDWEEAYAKIALNGFLMADMPSSNAVWGALLRQHGFRRGAISNDLPIDYNAEDFCRDNPTGVFVLGFTNHVATIVDGVLYDAWNSSFEIPEYVWYKKENPPYDGVKQEENNA